MLLFAGSRAQFVAEVVEPALRERRLLLSERYVDASIAYQGFGRGLDVSLVRRINEGATRGVMPDLTILLDIDPAVGLMSASQTTGKEGRPGHGVRLTQDSIRFVDGVRDWFIDIVD